MTFPKRESEPTTANDAATELSNEELATIDGGLIVVGGGPVVYGGVVAPVGVGIGVGGFCF
jgi:bacteriocin-like protein